MAFSDADLTELLGMVGGQFRVGLAGTTVATIPGRLKLEIVETSPGRLSTDLRVPVLLARTVDISGLTRQHTITATDGTAYKLARDIVPATSGLSRAVLMVAK